MKRGARLQGGGPRQVVEGPGVVRRCICVRGHCPGARLTQSGRLRDEAAAASQGPGAHRTRLDEGTTAAGEARRDTGAHSTGLHEGAAAARHHLRRIVSELWQRPQDIRGHRRRGVRHRRARQGRHRLHEDDGPLRHLLRRVRPLRNGRRCIRGRRQRAPWNDRRGVWRRQNHRALREAGRRVRRRRIRALRHGHRGVRRRRHRALRYGRGGVWRRCRRALRDGRGGIRRRRHRSLRHDRGGVGRLRERALAREGLVELFARQRPIMVPIQHAECICATSGVRASHVRASSVRTNLRQRHRRLGARHRRHHHRHRADRLPEVDGSSGLDGGPGGHHGSGLHVRGAAHRNKLRLVRGHVSPRRQLRFDDRGQRGAPHRLPDQWRWPHVVPRHPGRSAGTAGGS
mmetsp:Transcript_66994/g.170015  ORF Transcript_66994/g.170015 Transcript_66994/m.170015 type:complete len:402 (-) Transcript_66994:40-1245(-)